MRSNVLDKKAAKAFNKGYQEHRAGELAAAQEHYEEVLHRCPRHLDANYLLGTLLIQRGRLDDALKYLLLAGNLAPDSAMVCNNLGNVYLAKEDVDRALQYYQRAVALAPNLMEAHANLVRLYSETERLDEAIQHARRVAELAPEEAKHPRALGMLLLRARRWTEAAESFRRALEMGVLDEAVIRHFLDAMEGRTPAVAPREYARGLFDEYSERFEEQLTKHLEYKTPVMLREAVDAVCGPERQFANAVDLGCGTGLSGEAFAGRVGRLTGIDVSPRMIELARAKGGCYTDLRCGDVVEELLASDDRFDLLIAADVLVYLGELAALFAAVRQRATPQAVFTFSTELSADADFILQPTVRYAHSERYVQLLAERHGFQVANMSKVQLRKNYEHWIEGNIWTLTLPS